MTVVPEVLTIGPARLTAGLAEVERLDLTAHHTVHGGLRPLDSHQLVDLAERIALHGRGGAGFSFARKIRAVIDSAVRRGTTTAVVVNATEGEPGSWKDKMLLTRTPHLVLDGAALVAQALGASSITVGVADDGIGIASLLDAVHERRMPVTTRVVTVPHRFISGEGGALIRGINGDIPIPPGQRRHSSDSGVAGLPTLLSNAETFAQVAIAARLGPDAFADIGVVGEPGTVLLTVGGAACRPYVVETPTGVPLQDILARCQAPVGPAVLVGGYHGAWIGAADARTVTVSREAFSAAGGTLGAGIVLPLGEDTCPLGEVTRVTQYLAGQSAGQCGPCRLGLPDLARTMSTLTDGSGGSAAIDSIRMSAGAVRGRGACSHPDGAVRFVLSALETFIDDIATHLLHTGCGRPVRGVLPLPATEEQVRRLSVDWTRCDGHGLCAHLLPELIHLDGNGYPAFSNAAVPTWLEGGARKAVSMCPALALQMTRPNAAKPAPVR
ncbi:MAG TPA: NADH-ubiquinone oxidoreductase-F iron-sulfur binding region domain-containing protein [Micromonosporaceae bacterium]